MNDWNLIRDMVLLSDNKQITEAAAKFKTFSVVPCIAETINNAVQCCYETDDTMAATRDICWDIMHIMKVSVADSFKYSYDQSPVIINI